ncbi:hypothetical protein CBR_g31355 [Chara braunii]|uniref:Reverse transcriptase RNase H-like domain-containing protein n=1 Tax=Chara braunii TaxID=69332 RepID=A0A388LEQ8_CHABU|nr:hypothetical protein CBR_g31355 [Chara braunii]|eukprot:GBG80799.1 hypothetical protein CBR_g31355 [Chara braunii]
MREGRFEDEPAYRQIGRQAMRYMMLSIHQANHPAEMDSRKLSGRQMPPCRRTSAACQVAGIRRQRGRSCTMEATSCIPPGQMCAIDLRSDCATNRERRRRSSQTCRVHVRYDAFREGSTSTYERELYDLRQALDHWKHYLLGRHFKVYLDQETLRWLKT